VDHAKRLFGWAATQHVYGLTKSPIEHLRPSAIVGKKRMRQRVLTDKEMRALGEQPTSWRPPIVPVAPRLSA
jgi:hypothetical protein